LTLVINTCTKCLLKITWQKQKGYATITHQKRNHVETEDYRISFFRPTTQRALINRNLTIKLFIVWAVAIFGFQVLLKIFEKPVPEEALVRFTPAWNNVLSGQASEKDYQVAGQSMVQVMGKLTLSRAEFATIQDGVGWMLSNVYPEDQLSGLQQDVQKVNSLREQITSLQDSEYLAARELVIASAAPALGIEEGSLLAQLLPMGLTDNMAGITEENKQKIPEIMHLYMTHNRSFLTDTIFLGFPFHYFYTAVFLLTLFIALCWYYCYKIDRLHARLNFAEKTD
jgi:putative solute:sodium symporter small subunit